MQPTNNNIKLELLLYRFHTVLSGFELDRVVRLWHICVLALLLTLYLLVSVVKLQTPFLTGLKRKWLNFLLKIKTLEDNFLI